MYTFLKGVSTNIYIGRNAGKRVLQDIRQASKSVRIISPYLAPELAGLLREKEASGVSIELVTTNEITQAPKSQEIIRELVEQIRTTRPLAMSIRKWGRGLSFVCFLLLAGGCARLAYLNADFDLWALMALACILPFIIFSGIRTYDYTYKNRFNIKCLISPHCGGSFKEHSLVHAKLFIIDDRVAFLGSLNYTWPGMKYNVESCIHIIGKDAVAQIVQAFHELPKGMEQANLEILAHKCYQEPAN